LLALQRFGETLREHRMVVDDEDSDCGGGRHGHPLVGAEGTTPLRYPCRLVRGRRRERLSGDASARRLAFVRAVGDIDPRLELDALLQRVADVALAVGARSAAVAIRVEEGWRIVGAGEELAEAATTAERIARGVTGAASNPAEATLFGLPVRGRGGPIGALWVVSHAPLADEDRALVESLAGLVSAAAADATLFASEDEASERARRHDRLEAGFASMVSHELRSPLAAIRGFGRLLLDRDKEISDEERREFLEAVVRQADRMASLVDDVLDVAQMEAGAFHCAFAPYDARALFEDCVAEISAAFGDHPVEVSIAGALPEARGDAVRLKQVLLNVLSNACRYSPERAPVAVWARASGRPPGSTTDSTPGSTPAIEIDVTDRGPGIAPGDRDRVFARFGRLANEQTHRARGAGLGLYIARQIVELHGGTISVSSEPGAGATFHVVLPLEP
jgi:signal transduction histidine kinase